mmetsp:Transcript_16751/g.31090  ORF Transcript_16751/g.31090 Transcript_16751/m.31090 type:complete len:91 (+) Transcript_16751:986-1258(+)
MNSIASSQLHTPLKEQLQLAAKAASPAAAVRFDAGLGFFTVWFPVRRWACRPRRRTCCSRPVEELVQARTTKATMKILSVIQDAAREKLR